jgi:hypothetical protein
MDETPKPNGDRHDQEINSGMRRRSFLGALGAAAAAGFLGQRGELRGQGTPT